MKARAKATQLGEALAGISANRGRGLTWARKHGTGEE